jgi:hypothetical protein
MHWPYFLHLRSILEQRLGNAKAAADHAERALAMASLSSTFPSLQMPPLFARLAWARAALADRAGANEALDEAIARSSPIDRKIFEERRELMHVEADMNAGDMDRAAEGLARVLPERRARGELVFMPSRPDLAARFANLALERGIETAYVRMLIERHGLVAPDDVGFAVAIPAADSRAGRIRPLARRRADALHREDAAKTSRSVEVRGFDGAGTSMPST